MRASTARLINSPVRLADLTFPQANRLIHRTRLGFIHLDNLLAFAKRDRDGRVDGYITAYLPDECLLLFFRKGEAVNAASLHTTGRQVVTITEALKRMRGEVERGELVYAAAPMEQLAWMYQSCAAPVQSRFVDPEQPGAFFPALQQEQVSGVLELISNGRVSYLRFESGRFASGYFCDRPDAQGAVAALGAARRGHAGRRGAARRAVERARRLVAAAARGGGGRDAGHGAQDPARGHQGAPLCAAGRRLLHAAALAGGVVRCPARSTWWRRRSVTWTTSRRARPRPCAARG